MARSIECQCDPKYTCRYCLQNVKPWHFTLSDGSAIYVPRPLPDPAPILSSE